MKLVRVMALLAAVLTTVGLVAFALYVLYIARLWSQAMKA